MSNGKPICPHALARRALDPGRCSQCLTATATRLEPRAPRKWIDLQPVINRDGKSRECVRL